MIPAVLAVLAAALTSVSANEICYDGLPCFSIDKPWKSTQRLVPSPSSPTDVGTEFTLYSRGNPAGQKIQTWPEIVLDESSGYTASKPTFFICHGYFNNGNFTWMKLIKDAVLNLTDGNVFIVGWGHGSLRLNYYQSVANTRVVGAEMTRLGKYMMSNLSADPSTFHLIGHSLGAQAVSYMGKAIANISQITALDPAQPGYEGYSCEVRLCQGDARFIQAIHTDAKPFAVFLGLGFMEPVADVDFYMNGGANQPGCKTPTLNLPIGSVIDVATLPIELFGELLSCDHLRSIQYFLSALTNKNCTFWGHHTTKAAKMVDSVSGGMWTWLKTTPNCTISTCSPLGFQAVNYPARGTFEVSTSSSTPYCVLDKTNDLIMAKAMQSYKSTS